MTPARTLPFSRSTLRCLSIATLLATALAAQGNAEEDRSAVDLPEGVHAVWDLDLAHREATPTRERVSINGLWRWQPAADADEIPTADWGYFKVPGCWPGITDYLQKDSQTVFVHPTWRDRNLANVSAAWYERDLTLPTTWNNRRIALHLDTLNSLAVVYLDQTLVGEIRFPGGELDLTAAATPGKTQRLSLLVLALPLKGVMLSYTDSASAREVQGRVERRGLCGNATLLSTPAGPRISDVRATPSFRRQELTVDAGIEGLAPRTRYQLRARLTGPSPGQDTAEFLSPLFNSAELQDADHITFTVPWMPAALWDLPTPTNQCELELALLDADQYPLDIAGKERFGFREFWTEGRDFYLNGSRIFLSAVPLDNAQVGAALATYAAARESLERLQEFGINFVYTHNYGCEPGSHLAFDDILRAADDTGMLVGFSQPHFSHYDWKGAAADTTNGYARHAESYVRIAQNHPSVVMYAMSHNATGYNEDMNPDMIDGLQHGRDNWATRNAAMAQRAEAIVRRLDPGRIVYHHASGNLGSMHPINFYPNFAPIQELSDWFQHWATTGVKPVFLCEYGAPFSWDWTMYRGWYQGKREFGSAVVPWEFCLAEWNAQFLGDPAYQISDAEIANLRWEARQFRAGRLWHRWDYPTPVGSSRFTERFPIFAAYLTANWRAFRTWEVSATSPWEYGSFWTPREGINRSRHNLPVDWDHLQKPGFSPDYIDQRYERMDLAFERTDWTPTLAAQALYRNNRPLLGYLAGPPTHFTAQDHNFVPGESLMKQMIVINNSRVPVTCEINWSLNLPEPLRGRATLTLPTGQLERVPLKIPLPQSLPPGTYSLNATFHFGTGETQTDEFPLHILPLPPPSTPTPRRIACFDPPGETTALLTRLHIPTTPVDAQADFSAYDCLILGKAALTLREPAPDLRHVRDGLRVIVFEQSPEVLEKRLGFRVAQYGLRNVFPRVPDHPALAGLNADHLRDWRGEATLLPPRLHYQLNPKFNGAPTVEWCGLPVTRLWRCGNRGNVASALIEKPTCGDFLPIVDGGFSLQYSPLLEVRQDLGLVLLCQLDVTGRTEPDPVADAIVRNLVQYAGTWKPSPRRSVVYLGEPAGRAHLESIGLALQPLPAGGLRPDQLLVLGPGGGRDYEQYHAGLPAPSSGGPGALLALGSSQEDAAALNPNWITLRQAEHIATFFPPPPLNSPLAGIGPADVHNRDPRELPLLVGGGGAQPVGNGVLAQGEISGVAFCQLVPWQFDPAQSMNLKRTHRRVSFLVSRLLANLGAAGPTPLLERLSKPLRADRDESRWLNGFYLDQPEEWDDPYRFFRW